MKGYKNNMSPVENSLYDYFRKYAEENGNHKFLFDEERSYTAAEAFSEVEAIANACYDFGVREGSLVALRCTRCIDSFLIYLALQNMGATAVLTDPHQGAEAFLRATGIDMTVDFIISNEETSDDLSASDNWKLSGNNKSVSLPVHYPAVREPKRYPNVTDLYAPATIVFTSGSTGKAKAVMLNQYNIVNHFLNHSIVTDFGVSDCSVELMPVHHVFGLGLLVMGLIKQYTVFFPKVVSLEYTAACIEKYRITWLDSVPTFMYALAEYHKHTNFDATSLRGGNLGGAPSTKAQFDFIESELGMKLLPVYGQSECIAIAAGGDWESDVVRASTVGKFLPMNEGYILDEDGCEVPLEQEGEICVKGPAVLIGYFCDDKATREAIDEKGRLHTGDLGWVDKDGYLHISGRKKDIIIRNGHNLSSAAIEQKLLTLPFVSKAAVVGVKDEKCGEAPVAIITLKPGHGYNESDAMAAFNKLEQPRGIRVVTEIPLTSSGKFDKQKIKELFS